jgi:hypothetical protein
MADGVAEQGVIPDQIAIVGARVGIQQQFVRVEAVAGIRFVWAVNAVAVDLARADVR